MAQENSAAEAGGDEAICAVVAIRSGNTSRRVR